MKKKAWKRILSLTLCLLLVLSFLPATLLGGVGAAEEDAFDKTADLATHNEWTEFFGPNKLSTEFSGGVWTDKSVFEDASAFSGVTMKDTNSFLVALSAISATVEIEGQTSGASDVMLVLDLSNSMDTAGSVPSMVRATNTAIQTLLEDNDYNRVGVVLYSGKSTTGNADVDTAKVILPLDRYTAGTWNGRPAYLNYTGTSENTVVNVAEGVENSKGDEVSGKKTTDGGTYIQNGLFQAWQEFEKVKDARIDAPGSAMNGVQRTPIFVLMSDGAPTTSTSNYFGVTTTGGGPSYATVTNIGTSNIGTGRSSSNSQVFVTQLTAAWVKASAAAHYGTKALFYTLGLGTASDANATGVLYPAGSNSIVAGWWQAYLRLEDGKTLDRNNSPKVVRKSIVTEMNYVDEYWSAADSDELIEKFAAITSEIKLQNAGYSTLVEATGADLSGYVSFEDEIGELMHVRQVKGIQLGDTLYTGQEMARAFYNGTLGSVTRPSTLGSELIATMRERIGIDTSTAQQLVGNAYNARQLYYNRSTGEYSNYIGWYSDANGNYLGFWQESYGFGMDTAPADAVYINKSYGYLGENGDSNMMHVVVNTRMEIATTHQDVLFKIPAGLLPMVTYLVELEGGTLASGGAMTRVDAQPIRLLYEVGLREDINAINVEKKVAEYLAEDPENRHVHKNAEGAYEFYTNSWGTGSGATKPAVNTGLLPYVTESHFSPDVNNDRYYYTEDTPIYTRSGDDYVPYTGEVAPSGSGYYRDFTIITTGRNGGSITANEKFLPISEVVLEKYVERNEDGAWVVKAGTAFRELTRFELLKGGDANDDGNADANLTGTLEWSDHPLVVLNSQEAEDYEIYAVLGNNGKLSVTPAQGIRVSKTVAEKSDDYAAPTEFEFEITLKPAVAENVLSITDADGNPWAEADYEVQRQAFGESTVITLSLADGEEVYITGLPNGTEYTVEEIQTVYYNTDYEEDLVTGTVVPNEITHVPFVNAPRELKELEITKTVLHPFSEDPAALREKVFKARVTLTEKAYGHEFYDTNGNTYVADENGSFVVELKHGSAVTIVNILEDTPYTVEEIDIPAGFELVEAQSAGLTGKIPGSAHIVNEYVPTPPAQNPDVTVTVNKALTGNYSGPETFKFLLQMFAPTNPQAVDGYITVAELDVDYPAERSVVYDLTETVKTFQDIGTNTFRIMEVTGTTTGMTYSVQRAFFQVNVVDPELDGILQVDVVALANTSVIRSEEEDQVWHTVTAAFENIYYVDSTYVDVSVSKTLTNNTGVDISLTHFGFGLFTDPNGTTPVEGAVAYADPRGNAVIRIPVTSIDQNGDVYYLKEIVPEEKMLGMTYDESVYKLTLSVDSRAASGEGDAYLVATAAVELYSGTGTVTGGAATFKNSYDLGEISATIKGDKDLVRGYNNEQLPVAEGDYSFQLWSANENLTTVSLLQTVENGEGGAIAFAPIEYTKVGTYHYIVREVAGSERYISYDAHDVYVTVIVADNGNGGLQAEVHYRKSNETAGSTLAKFTNTYNLSGTDTVSVSGTKVLQVLQGVKTLTGGEFAFELKDSDGKVLQTKTNAPNGHFSFAPLHFSAADVGKTYTYTVSEVEGENAGISYDETVFEFTVEVKDVGDGTIDAVYALSGGRTAIEFVNTYTAESTTATFSGTKTLTGRQDPITAGEFTFELYKTDEKFTNRTYVKDITHNAEGEFSFDTEEYTAIGTYYYVLREKIPTGEDRPAGMHYDAGEYHLTVQVVDRGIGKLETIQNIYRPGVGNADITFSNSYAPVAVDVELTATKSYDKPLNGGEFTFELKQGDEVLQTVNNGPDGEIAFSTLTFEETGVYTYTVAEVPGDKEYIRYDDTVYTLVITVTDGNGELVADVQVQGESDAVTFENTYVFLTGGALKLTGTKTLTGDRTAQTAGEFTFQVKDAFGQVVSEGENDASGNIIFDAIPYTHANIGTHEYTVVEVKGSNDGMDYDDTEYKVVVTVADNGEGGLSVTHTVDGMDNKAITFQNTYTITESDEISLTGQKILDGRDLQAGEFSFKLATAEGVEVETVKNATGGAITFAALQFGPEDLGQHTYVVTEIDDGKGGVEYDNTIYTVVITVADNGNGGVTVTKTVDSSENKQIIFRNSYSVDGTGSALIAGVKNLDGDRTQIRENEFSFVLKDSTGTEVQTVKVAADGSFAFDELTYTEEDIGTHSYTVSEVKGSNDGMDYDEKVYDVEVTVADNGLGGILVTKTVDGKAETAITFQNTYTIEGSEEIVLSGTKVLTGRAPEDGEFTFKLSKDGEDLQTVSNVGDAVTFEKLTFTQSDIGSHTFVITEVAGNNPGVTYSSESYTVLVTVSDDGNGGIAVTKTVNGSDVPIVFNNKYQITGTAELKLDGSKTLTGDRTTQTAGEFKFEVKNGAGQVVSTGTNDAAGNITFRDITYTAADLGEHTYVVSEVKGNNAGMAYDETEYTVKVTVADDKQGGIIVTATELPTLSFANSYSITRPGELNLRGTKTLTGNRTAQTAGEFKFEVKDEAGQVVSTGENDASGNIGFQTISYTADDLGEHTYVVSEVKGTNPGMTYDTATYTVKVTVADDGNGGITVTATELPVLAFANTYTITGTAELELKGTKSLSNRDLTDGEFAFEVKDEAGQVVSTGKNDAQGNITFEPITYTVADLGEYTYTVSEKNDECYGITYDENIFTVEVTVADDGNGGIAVTKTVDPTIAFNNVYTPDLEVSFGVEKKVETTATTMPSVKGFEFTLADGITGKTIATASSDEQGVAAFGVTYTKADIGKSFTYKITEDKGNKRGWEYDTATYLVTVTVGQNADGTLNTTKTVDEEAVAEVNVTFTNIYKPPATPGTGDLFNPLFALLILLCAAAGVVVMLVLRKKRS